MESKGHIIRNINGVAMEFNIYVEKNLLKIEVENSDLTLYNYDELVNYDEKFKKFHSINEIYTFILLSIQEEKIQIIKNKAFILKNGEENFIIPFKKTKNLLPNELIKYEEHLPEKYNYSSRLKITRTIDYNGNVKGMGFLKDGRFFLVGYERLAIYNDYITYADEPSITIRGLLIESICPLRNGNLAICEVMKVKIYEIGKDYYKHIVTLTGHTRAVVQVIEVEDGRLFSCSQDKTIKVWNVEQRNCIATIEGHKNFIQSIIKLSADSIVSFDEGSKVKIWNQQTYQLITEIQGIRGSDKNAISRITENKIIIGRGNELIIINTLSLEIKLFKSNDLGIIKCVCVLKENQIFLGNTDGKIHCYDPLSDQIIYTKELYRGTVDCIIKTEDGQLFSAGSPSFKSLIYIYG